MHALLPSPHLSSLLLTDVYAPSQPIPANVTIRPTEYVFAWLPFPFGESLRIISADPPSVCVLLLFCFPFPVQVLPSPLELSSTSPGTITFDRSSVRAALSSFLRFLSQRLKSFY